MTLDLTDEELAYLDELLEDAHKRALHELHHTDTAAFKAIVRKRIDALEAIRAKLERRDKPA